VTREGEELRLRFASGPLRGRVVTARDGTTLGRSRDNELVVPDQELSRHHFRFVKTRDGFYVVEDLASTNGTYVRLAGPYAKTDYGLSFRDQILVARTGFSVNRLDYGLSESKGCRATMDDRSLLVQDLLGRHTTTFAAVYDGHGGDEAAVFLKAQLHRAVRRELLEDDDDVPRALTRAFLATDAEFLRTSSAPSAGSTAILVLLRGSTLHCANVGDSRAVLCRGSKAVPLSFDHRPTRAEEAARIRNAGGWVFRSRVLGELAVSRAFGNVGLKRALADQVNPSSASSSASSSGRRRRRRPTEERPSFGSSSSSSSSENPRGDPPETTSDDEQDRAGGLVIAEPEIRCLDLAPDDAFCVLASDGLFDLMTNAETVAFVKAQLDDHGDPQQAADALVAAAIHDRGSRDNVSAIVLDLHGLASS